MVDTLFLEPDQDRFLLVWRASFPLRRTVHEIRTVLVGRTREEWERAEGREQRQAGKQRYSSLADAVRGGRDRKAK